MEVVGWAFKLAVVVLVALALWAALRPRYAFEVRIENGVPRVTRGKVTAAYLQEVAQACSEARVAHGWVGGQQRGRQVTVACSRNIPPAVRQRLRNLWALHG